MEETKAHLQEKAMPNYKYKVVMRESVLHTMYVESTTPIGEKKAVEWARDQLLQKSNTPYLRQPNDGVLLQGEPETLELEEILVGCVERYKRLWPVEETNDNR